MTVIKGQNKVRAVRQRLDRVPVTFGKIPNVPCAEVRHFTLALRVDDGDAGMAFQHKRPFGGNGVPVQLADTARLQRHIYPGNAFRNRELFDGGLSGPPAGQAAFFAVGKDIFIKVLCIGGGLESTGRDNITMFVGAGGFKHTDHYAGCCCADRRGF
ncbi:hypothetical protein D3C80_1208430 [compost metagenome]